MLMLPIFQGQTQYFNMRQKNVSSFFKLIYMKFILSLVALFVIQIVNGQTLTGEQLLEKAIQYHDPQGLWSTFSGELKLEFTGPAMTDRASVVTIDIPNEFFNVSSKQEGKTSFREIKNNNCRFSAEDGKVSEASLGSEECARTVMFKNYYSYLYGLPMKLKDPGTLVNSSVKELSFKGKDYLVLQVSYDEAVGSDVWQFYFNPESYAMEVYQFFKGDDVKTGEYILLSGEMVVNGIKMPKDRAWYYNKDDGYLGTDKLVEK